MSDSQRIARMERDMLAHESEEHSKVDRLKKICQDNGICTSCGSHWVHHIDEPFASCDCKTGEDTIYNSPFMKLQKRCWDSEARNAQLLEALTKAHSILLHEMDNGRTPTQLQGVGLGYFEDVIAGLDPSKRQS